MRIDESREREDYPNGYRLHMFEQQSYLKAREHAERQLRERYRADLNYDAVRPTAYPLIIWTRSPR